MSIRKTVEVQYRSETLGQYDRLEASRHWGDVTLSGNVIQVRSNGLLVFEISMKDWLAIANLYANPGEIY